MRHLALMTLAWLALLAQPPARAFAASAFLRDATAEAGISFQQRSAPEKKYILESMAGGVAMLDFDGDGLLDIYFVNSLTVQTADQPESASSALYRNLGDGSFLEVAERAGVATPGWGMGVCTADVDGDGWQDIYVTTVGDNRLYLNRGDGTFRQGAEEAGVTAGGWSAGCGFADYDRDGDLDLFVSRYVEVDLDNLPEFGKGKFCRYRGIEVQCGPRGLPGTSDLLFRNRGDGTFDEVSQSAGVADPNEYFGLGVAWFDADADGWLDLFVANDSGPNFLYRNKKDGTFEEFAFPLGVAVSEDGGEQGSMGIAVGDYKNEGRPSLFVTNFSEEPNALYYNSGDFFTDVSFRSATAPSSLPYVGWGTAFLDYDNDGWQDLIVVNGHVYPQLDNAQLGASAPYRQRKLLYRNLRDGTFDEIAESLGEPLTELRVSRGLALGDLDRDGRPDLAINDLDGPAQLLRNERSEAGSWLQVGLTGAGRLTDAIGAVIQVDAAKLSQLRIVQSGTSYLSQSDMFQHFGLGGATAAGRVEIRWPEGSVTRLSDLPANRVVRIFQKP